MVPLLQATRSVPVVFVNVADPVGSGFIESLARPGGNVTGFANFEYGVASKWMELLKEISPSVTRTAVMREPANPAGIGQWAIIQAAAPIMGVDVSPINLTGAPEIEKALANFARTANGGLIVTPSGAATNHRKLIIALAARHKLPAIYSRKLFVVDGGLMSYGIDVIHQFRQAAGYADRILRGETPADLPAQAPTKYELVINLKTAKGLGITVSQTLLARAEELIE
jgi:putative tryptophan/tyrosine transport system substrate-binding protein